MTCQFGPKTFSYRAINWMIMLVNGLKTYHSQSFEIDYNLQCPRFQLSQICFPLLASDSDVIVTTESWFSSAEVFLIEQLTPLRSSHISCVRNYSSGRGILINYYDCFYMVSKFCTPEFYCFIFDIKLCNVIFTRISVYRKPSGKLDTFFLNSIIISRRIRYYISTKIVLVIASAWEITIFV